MYFFSKIIYDATGKMLKPIIIHDKNLPQQAVDMFRIGLDFKETCNGDLDKASFDFALDRVAT